MLTDDALTSEAISPAPETSEHGVASEPPPGEDASYEELAATSPESEPLAAEAAESHEEEIPPASANPRLELLPMSEPRVEIPPFQASRPKIGRDFAMKGAAAGLALLILIGGAAAYHGFGQSALLASKTPVNEDLTAIVANLRDRLDSLDAARAKEETADIRKVLGELKAQASATHDVGAAIGQLTSRVDRVERDQGAHLDKLGDRMDHDSSSRFADLAARIDKLEKKTASAAPVKADEFAAPIAQLSARVDKLGERIERETSPRFADLSGRLDKLEKKTAAPSVASVVPAPAKPALVAANVSNETTGSIERPKPPLRGYMVVDVRDGYATIEGREGAMSVAPGDTLPGLGRVLRIERRGREWDVVTSLGVISSVPPGY